MQLPAEKIRHSKYNRLKASTKSPHISSFRILNRNGLEIPSGSGVALIEEDNQTKPSEFQAQSMPEQASGYIKCKKHDFL
ncbi:MAG: hypothetical protein ABI675_01000 [Chitinophagaceae bacterium]